MLKTDQDSNMYRRKLPDQSRAEQSRAEQSRAEQSRAEQSRANVRYSPITTEKHTQVLEERPELGAYFVCEVNKPCVNQGTPTGNCQA